MEARGFLGPGVAPLAEVLGRGTDATASDFARCAGSVSYTHLDVYKRQAITCISLVTTSGYGFVEK